MDQVEVEHARHKYMMGALLLIAAEVRALRPGQGRLDWDKIVNSVARDLTGIIRDFDFAEMEAELNRPGAGPEAPPDPGP
jgi:hypothetical protein